MTDDTVLCYECKADFDPNRERESSGYCPETCDNCGSCTGCDQSC